MCGEKLYLKCLSIQTLLSLLVGWNTPTEVFHHHHTKEENQRRETHLPGWARLFCSTELSSQHKKRQKKKQPYWRNGFVLPVHSVYSLSVLFQSVCCPLCISWKKQSEWIFVVIVYSGDMTDMGSVTDMEPRHNAHRVARRRSRGSFVFHAYCEI